MALKVGDPAFASTLDRVRDEGVEVLAYACEMSPQRVVLGRRIRWFAPTPRRAPLNFGDKIAT